MKFSKTQMAVLKELAKPGAMLHFTSGLDAHWWLSTTYRGVRFATVEKLEELGMIEVTLLDEFTTPKSATITEAGQKVVEGDDV